MLASSVNFPCTRGKVRDVYDLGDGRLAIVATDRISAFDKVLPDAIPRKGEVLTRLSEFWFNRLDCNNHFLTTDIKKMPAEFQEEEFTGRTMMVRKLKPLLVECVVRGYLAGSLWNRYKREEESWLPAGLHRNQALLTPAFTPTTKEDTDRPLSVKELVDLVGGVIALELQETSIKLYNRAARLAWSKGVIIADTKFEFGKSFDQVVLIDEVLTPDSSRFWAIEDYCLDRSPSSLDKQSIRDYLDYVGWDKISDPPNLPTEIINKTTEIYLEAYRRITGLTI